MQNNDAVNEVMNDLLKINNDRIAGYERAINETKDLDVDLKAMFEGMIQESTEYKQELTGKIRQNGGAVESGTTNSGKIYRAWMDVKATFTGSNRKAILASCEFGEDAAQRAYDAALSGDVTLPEEVRKMITDQQQALNKSHDVIKKYRDAHEALS